MDKTNHIKYGLAGIFQYYGWKSFFKDMLYPLVLGIVVLVITSQFGNVNIYNILCEILGISMTIIPIIVTLILTSFTLFISLFTTNKSLTRLKDLKKILMSMTSTYSAGLVLSICALGVLFIFYVISRGGYSATCATLLNYVCLFLTVCALSYPFVVLINIVIDLYNSGKICLTINDLPDDLLEKQERSDA